jgi:two-component system OmpR family sensor kinase
MRGSSVLHVPWRARPARWLAARSLRAQLITGLVALVALAFASVGIVTYIVLSHTLLNQLDYQLDSAGGRYASCMEQKHHEGPPNGIQVTNCNRAPGLNTGTFGARVKDGVVTDQGIIGGSSPVRIGQGHLDPAAARRRVLQQEPGLHPRRLPAHRDQGPGR